MTLHNVHVQSMEKGGGEGGDDITQCTCVCADLFLIVMVNNS